jgi:tryptophanyl-tRNA synthetase
MLKPIREESLRLIAEKAYLESVYKEGALRASQVAGKTLSKVYRKLGFVSK